MNNMIRQHKERIKKERKSFKVTFIMGLINDLDQEQYKELTKQIKENK